MRIWPGLRTEYAWLPVHHAPTTTGRRQIGIAFSGHRRLVYEEAGRTVQTDHAPGVTIVTGVFPVVAAGGLLWLLGAGLQFASVIALTISFGLGLSATRYPPATPIHNGNQALRPRHGQAPRGSVVLEAQPRGPQSARADRCSL